ncbi:MAG: uracil-DNA glycosylase [marine benthic group bacterium]|nr:uracil-DNA glycosylase [Candidatus Benthicola marisminoris]
MTDPREQVARYLRGREVLAEPEYFLTGERNRLLETMRTGQGGGSASSAGTGGAGQLARSGSRDDILAIEDMETLNNVAGACTRCSLHETRTKVVFADGTAAARVLCVGEAPGANEDRTGVPFVGRAGQLLDRLLRSVGFPRSEVFICNVLKCRPPGNRNPLPEEIERCSPFMLRQVELVSPAVIIALGTFAAQTLIGTKDSLRHLRGRTHLYEGFPLVVTYHPAALLRNPGWTRPSWLDLQLARRIADGDHAPRAVRSRDEAGARGAGETSEPTAQALDQLSFGGRDV